jgi:phage terminase large subunit-like protein
VWSNGARALLLSADEPDGFRGHQSDAVLADELAAWRYPDAWDQLLMGLRLGSCPQACITTTPRPTPIIRALLKDSATVVTRGSTFDNKANLAAGFLGAIARKYEGTRLGRQELLGEVLDDTPGALWTYQQLDSLRIKTPVPMLRIVVSIDPSVTSNENSDETGIVVVGIGLDGYGYVLRDASGIYTPGEQASVAVAMVREFQADAIVVEVNNGGDFIENTIRTVDRNVRVVKVRATRGKLVRAEPVAALYEQRRVFHVGSFPQLEDQMCQWSPANGGKSPDRMDALVWGFTELLLGESGGEYYLPNEFIA